MKLGFSLRKEMSKIRKSDRQTIRIQLFWLLFARGKKLQQANRIPTLPERGWIAPKSEKVSARQLKSNYFDYFWEGVENQENNEC